MSPATRPSRFNKPWFRHQPLQLLRRIRCSLQKTPVSAVVHLPWNIEIEVDPRETIGWSIWTTGVTDLAVGELICRLCLEGDIAVDVGANVGYMTGLMAACVGASGEVDCFEPNPDLLPRLRRNLDAITSVTGVSPQLHPIALADFDGIAQFSCSGQDNHGLGRIVDDDKSGVSVSVQRLDQLEFHRIDVVKIDVEGHESAVIRGADSLLRAGKVRNVIFEEHGDIESESFRLLQQHGYDLFRLGWHANGLVLAALSDPPVHSCYEPPNFVGTLDSDRLHVVSEVPGFKIFERCRWQH